MGNQIDLGAAPSPIREGMRVVDVGGKVLGTATNVRYDTITGELAEFVVQHGLFGRKHKPIPAHLVKQIGGDVVTVKFSVAEFKELKDIEDRA